MSHILQANGNRIYEVGGKYIEVPKIVVEKIRSFATKPFDVGEKHDKKVVELLLIVCVGTKITTGDKIDKDVRDFVHGNTQYSYCQYRLN